jgi:anti-anti-sigma factor
MTISSRTPEGRSNHCPVCGSDLMIEPSDPAGDAPCPRCEHLLWFVWEDLGDIQVARPTGRRLDAESWNRLIDSVTVNNGVRLVIDFGDVHDMSSAILGKLINLKKQVAAVRGQVRLRSVHPDVLEVFRITHLDQVFEIEA